MPSCLFVCRIIRFVACCGSDPLDVVTSYSHHISAVTVISCRQQTVTVAVVVIVAVVIARVAVNETWRR